jgi:outer membrane protein
MKKTILLLCGFILLSAGLSAQTISLEQARILALQNSRSLAQSNLSLQNSKLSERSSSVLYSWLPSLNASYNISANYLDKEKFVNPIDSLSANASLSISISQTFFDGSSIQRKQKSFTTESARRSTLTEYYTVLDNIDNAYYAVLEATANLEAAESSLQTAIFSLSMAEIRQEGGIINLGDYLSALADKERYENSRNQARRTLTIRMTTFRNLTGITGAVELKEINFSPYEDLLLRLAGISDEEADALYSECFKILALVNPSLASSASNIQTAEMELSLAKRNFFPTISVGVNLNVGRIDYSASATPASAAGFSTNLFQSGSISISGRIPLDFWVLNDQLEQRKIAVSRAALDYANAISSQESNLLNVLFNTFTQAESVLSSRRSLAISERNFEYATERYRLGQSSVKDFGDASSQIITSRNSYTRAYYGFLQSLSSLRSLLGIDNEEELIALLMSR